MLLLAARAALQMGADLLPITLVGVAVADPLDQLRCLAAIDRGNFHRLDIRVLVEKDRASNSRDEGRGDRRHEQHSAATPFELATDHF